MTDAQMEAASQAPASMPNASNPDVMTDDQIAAMPSDQEKYGTPGQQVLAGMEGFGQGVLGFVAPLLERGFGEKPEDIRGRAEASPWTHGLSEATGFGVGMLTGTGAPALLSKAGELVSGVAKGAGLASKIGIGAAKMATEMALLQAGDEATKYIVDAPTSVGSAVTNIGLSALLGGATGGAFSGLGLLAKKGIESIPEGLTEFTDRLKYRMSGADPTAAFHSEAETALDNFNNANDEIWGPQGLKAQAMQKVLPEMSEKIMDQANNLVEKAKASIDLMAKDGVPDRFIKKVEGDSARYEEVVTKPGTSSSEVFDATQDLKKSLQAYSKGKWGEEVLPAYHEAYDFINHTKNLGREIRLALEDPKVWGDAANIQKDLNKAFSEVLPAVKDLKSKFTYKDLKSKFNSKVDPTKVQSYFNDNGKVTSQSIRQQMVGNFVDKFDKYQSTVNDIYNKAGVENPFGSVGMSAMRESLEKVSPWAKAADAWYEKALTQAGATVLGGAAGAYVGEKSGIPGGGYAGLMLGGAVGKSLIPAILQPMMEKAVNASAFQRAIKFGEAALKGEKLINGTAKGIFKAGAMSSVKYIMPDQKTLDKLDQRVQEVNSNPQKLMDNTGVVGHYMPAQANEATALGGRTAQYLNSLKPKTIQNSPLDTKIEPTKAQMSAYNRQLSIAEQPLQVMQHIKDGTLQPQDIVTLQTMSPALFSQMTKAVYNQMTQHMDEGGQIPYKTKQSLSLFLGHPLDSTFTPSSIQSAQMVFMPKAPMQPQGNATGKGKGQASKLGKTNNSYMTPGQAAEKDRSGRD